MKEEWKPVVGYEDLYLVSNQGRVYSIRNDRYLKPAINDHGYMVVNLVGKDKYSNKHWRIHRLMMLAFVGPVPGKPVVNHIDGIKTHNVLENLEWCTSSENNKHAYDTGLKTCESFMREYHVKYKEVDKVVLGAKAAAKALHDAGYFLDIDEYNIKAALTKCALAHALYLGQVFIEATDDPYDEPREYHKCGMKGKPICAELPSGLIVKAKGSAQLYDRVRKLGYWKNDTSRDTMVKLISGTANGKAKTCYGIRVWFADE